MHLRFAALLAALLTLASCGVDTERLNKTAWQLTEGLETAADYQTVHFTGDGMSGFDGCAPWFSETQFPDGGRLDIRELQVLTDSAEFNPLGCTPAESESSERFLTALGQVTDVGLKDGLLTLRGGDAELRFEPVGPVDLDQFVNVRWNTRAVSDGRVLYEFGETTSFFLFDSDGTSESNTGCSDGRGTWEYDTFDSGLLDRMSGEWNPTRPCTDLLDSDIHNVMTGILDFGATAYVDGDKLIMSNMQESKSVILTRAGND